MKYTIALLLMVVMLSGCDKSMKAPSNKKPPIQIEAATRELTNQIKQILGDKFLKLGKVRFSDPVYHVEIFYKAAETNVERRLVIELFHVRYAITPSLVSYRGSLELNGKKDRVTIDEMMNPDKVENSDKKEIK